MKNNVKDTTSFNVNLHWRGLDIVTGYCHHLWGRERDRFYIKANEPFYKGGGDYLVKWLPSINRPATEQDVIEMTLSWLNDALDSSNNWRAGDMQRNQLSLFD